MDSPFISLDVSSFIRKYRVHIFIFFLVFFIGITLAHPAVLLNDEFITTNQIRQLHTGHQFIINEGRYGLAENGSLSGYFRNKSNILAYSLFLPIISLPAFWTIDIFGEQIAYIIIVTWTTTALILLLFINHYFTKFSYIKRWRWTNIAAAVVFLLFFVNLYYYSKFTIDPVESYPEILAIGMIHMVLLAFSGVLIYEICRTIFEDPAFSFFGAITCFFSSSYFFWSTFCKDHILVLACFVPIVLALIRFIKTDEYWYLPMAFLGCGLLAWARPEVGLWMAILVAGMCGYTLLRFWSQDRPAYSILAVVCSPLFTIIGALPFFINNYVVTGNIFLPVESVYLHDGNTTATMNASQSLMPDTGVSSIQSIIVMHLPAIPTSPVNTLGDLAGVFFYPTTGNLGVFTLVPIFFVMIVIGSILLIFKKIRFTPEEKRYLTLAFLVSGAVFMTYAYQIHSLNTDGGITPDIRYLSPMYFSLTIIGLIILKKIHILPEVNADNIRELSLIAILGVPLSIFMLCNAYPLNPDFIHGDIPIGKFFDLYVIALIILTLVVLLYCLYYNRRKDIATYLILLLCTVPFFWQVNTILLYFSFSGFAGHIFWIPVVRVFWDTIVNVILMH